MPSNLYTDANPEQAPPAAQAPAPDQSKPDPGKNDEPTASIPKALLAGKEFKPGDVVEMKVVQVMDDSVLIEYNHGEEGKEGGEYESPAEPETRGGGGMASVLD